MCDWDMYADVSLDHLVPGTGNVIAFSEGARVHGQWSDRPSTGAWVNLSEGGSTVAADATEAGQGNGARSHRTERKSSKAVGYFAPGFDGRHRPDDDGAVDPEECRILGVPQTHWAPGILAAAQHESSYCFNAVDAWDSNAVGPRRSDGHPLNCSRGVLQAIPSTFAAYHHPGTSNAIHDGVADIRTAMHHVMVRYGVCLDGSNLAGRVRQFDPTRRSGGY